MTLRNLRLPSSAYGPKYWSVSRMYIVNIQAFKLLQKILLPILTDTEVSSGPLYVSKSEIQLTATFALFWQFVFSLPAYWSLSFICLVPAVIVGQG